MHWLPKHLDCVVHCAAARGNYMTRVVEPGATRDFSERSDEALWQCLCQIVRISPTKSEDTRLTASFPMVLGGLRLRSATRGRQAAQWPSWGDCLPVHQRHPLVAATLVAQLSGVPETRSSRQRAKHELAGSELNHRRGRPSRVECAGENQKTTSQGQ